MVSSYLGSISFSGTFSFLRLASKIVHFVIQKAPAKKDVVLISWGSGSFTSTNPYNGAASLHKNWLNFQLLHFSKTCLNLENKLCSRKKLQFAKQVIIDKMGPQPGKGWISYCDVDLKILLKSFQNYSICRVVYVPFCQVWEDQHQSKMPTMERKIMLS